MAIIKCPECGHDVSSMAAACPNCGYPISSMNLKAPEQPEHAKLMEEQAQQNDALDEFDMIDSEPEQQQKGSSEGKNEKSRGVRPGVVILCIIVLAVTAYAIADIFKTHDKIGGMTSSGRSTSSRSYSSSYSSSRSSGSGYSSSEIKAGVYALAEKCVKKHLKSPSSAKFSSMSDCEFQKGEDGVYMMAGTVESENSYGAMLKETWGIMAQVDGDKVSLVMVQIGDQVYFD